MRLIDADAFDRTLEDAELEAKRNRKYVFASALNIIRGNLRNAPTIGERETGEWIEQDDGWDGVFYECSVCKDAFTLMDGTPSDNNYNFCPNCGADMREGEDG